MRTFGAFVRAFRKLWADASFRALVGLAGGLLVTGTVVYAVVEKWSLIDALYFCVVTLSTVGYGDLAPKTELGRGFTIIYILVGVGIIFAGAARIVEVMVAERTARSQASGTSDPAADDPS